MEFLTVEYSRSYNRNGFECTQPTLNNYIKLQATKESRRGLSKIYLLLDEEKNNVIGYYTLSSSVLPIDSIPEEILKKLPEGYTGYPAILIGRLAISKEKASKGLGGELLIDAILRCIVHSESIGISVIMVDPIDDDAVSFYKKYMFKSLPDNPRMILKIDNSLKEHFGVVL